MKFFSVISANVVAQQYTLLSRMPDSPKGDADEDFFGVAIEGRLSKTL